jgi:peptidoglycan endopeptidase LytE
MKRHLLTAAATAGILFASFSGTASAQASTYTVQSGDTLWKISQTYQISITDLKAWNQLSSDTLYVNQKLSLVAPTSEETTYTVQSGDTLWKISIRFSISVTQLKSINNLTSDTITIGQVLKISTATSIIPTPQMVINEANKYIGTPYLWGGNTPAGFDCSGFTKYVFDHVGISIPRTAATQWSGLKPVSTPNPGDLVFFETYAPGPSHVGIYLGNNKFIQAGSSGVSIADMTNTYWKPRYLGARTAF